MRHRIVYATGLGRSVGTDYNLDNQWKCAKEDKNKYIEMFSDAIKTFHLFSEYEGLDFGFANNSIFMGIEPSYQGDDLLIINLDLYDKNESYMITGHAFDVYGTGVRSRQKYYKEYKKKSKFTVFIDKWFDCLQIKGKER